MNFNVKQKVALTLVLVFTGLCLWAVYAIATIDTTRIVRIVSEQVKAATGRDLVINGPVSIKLFPRLAVVADQVSLSNSAWASDADMIMAKQVAFSLRWRPLLSKRIEIDNVSLDQMRLTLQAAPLRNKTAGNWIMDTPASNNQPSDAPASFSFDLAEVHLNQVSVIYKNNVGAVIDTLSLKRFDIKRAGNQVQLDGVMSWNGIPLTLKGETGSWQRLLDDWSQKPTNFALDVNLGVYKQSVRIRGDIAFSPNADPVVDLKLQSAAIDLQVIGAAQPQGTKGSRGETTSASNRVFSTEPLPFSLLPVWQGKVQTEIAKLTLPDGLQLEQFNAAVTGAAGDVLSLAPVTFKVGSGYVVADGRLAGAHTALPTLQVRGHATGFSFGQVMAQMGKGNLVSGGPTQAAFNLISRGASASSLAANANGALQISVGPATASNSLVNLGGDFLLSVANAINPLRKSSDTTQLQCMVAYLPVRSGQVQINQSIGMQTDRLDLTLDGQVNLGSETMRINMYPKEKSGLTTGVNPAGLVQITGTLANPSMGVNKAGVVKQAAGVGLAIVTGGISLLAQNAAGVVSRASPCDNVLRPWPQVAGGLVTSP